MKKLTLAMLCLLSCNAIADTVRNADGSSCQFDADDSNYSVELYAETGKEDRVNLMTQYQNYGQQDDHKIGVKFTYKFGIPDRLDCGKMYQQELKRRDLELEMLRKKLAALEATQDTRLQWK
jgi:hypothetical protein